jgi:hypothetical protein
MEIDYYEAFGVEAPQEEPGANLQETAEPAEAPEAEGVKGQEAADPAGDNSAEAEGSESASGNEPHQQSEEDNAKYAAARRKAEQERDAAVARAKQEAKAEYDRQLDQVFAHSGMTNPYTKSPIRSKADYDAYMERHNAEQKAVILKKTGMTEDQFEAFLNGQPVVRESAEKTRQAEQALRAARDAQAKAKIDEQIQQIHALDPTINSVGDLTKMENYQDFYGKVKSGMNFVDAYRLVNFDKLTAATAAKAQQQAINKQNSKAHLSRTKSRGSGTADVPESVMAEYKLFNPTITDEEIIAHYNGYLHDK